jgi:hypothetical protein
MSCQLNQPLTPEKYQEIKSSLENEDLAKFPSIFQQARTLAKQAWVSGIDVAKGKPLLASAEKAAARLEICQGCEFFKQDRCLKCGCFMNAKIHVESAACPMNKWGEKPATSLPVAIDSFSETEREEITELANDSLYYDGRFTYKKVQYRTKKSIDGNIEIYRMPKRPDHIPLNHVNTSSNRLIPEHHHKLINTPSINEKKNQQEVNPIESRTFTLSPGEKGSFSITPNRSVSNSL